MINLKSQPPRPRQRTHQPSYPAKLALGASVVALAAACGGVIESGADDTGNQLLGDQESSETTPEPRSETEKGGHGGEYGNEGGGATADNWEEEPESCDVGTGGTYGDDGEYGAGGGGGGTGWEEEPVAGGTGGTGGDYGNPAGGLSTEWEEDPEETDPVTGGTGGTGGTDGDDDTNESGGADGDDAP